MRYAWLAAIDHAWLPPICLLCGGAGIAADRDLCTGCAADLPRNQWACPKCAHPLTPGQNTQVCSHCRVHAFPFDYAFAPLHYQPPINSLIGSLKFSGRLSYARLLGRLFADFLQERSAPLPDCIVPVPLHPKRLRERGFNQALELARPAARCYGIPLLGDGLRRTRHTRPQTQLNAQQRRGNLQGAFALNKPLIGSRVAIMDDVITTASTVSECSRVLRQAGVTTIEVWAIARTADPLTPEPTVLSFSQQVHNPLDCP